MANKEFKIQSDTISLNGVPLSSSADGKVVIPGVTRATGYSADEVKEYDSYSDETVYNQGTPTIVDHYTYLAGRGSLTPPQNWVAATYSVILDDENKIDDIEIDSAGSNYPEEAVTINTDNMFISPSGLAPTPENLADLSADWVPTSYYIKMKASSVESDLGGGGSGNTGSITFEGVSIVGAGTASGDGNGYGTIELVPDETLYGNDQYLIIDPTSPGHIHIRAGGTQDASNADLMLGGEKNYVRVNDGSGVRLQNERVAENFYYYSDPTFTSGSWYEDNGNFYLEFTTTDQTMVNWFWEFSNDAQNRIIVNQNDTLTFAGWSGNLGNDVYKVQVTTGPETRPWAVNTIEFQIFTTQTNELYLENGDFRLEVYDDIRMFGRDIFRLINYSVEEPIEITTNYDNASHTWAFQPNGKLTFPNGGAIEPHGMGWIGLTNGTSGTPVSIAYKNTGVESPVGLAEIMLTGSGTNGVINLYTNNTDTSSSHSWSFDQDGKLTYPNGTRTSGNGISVPVDLVYELSLNHYPTASGLAAAGSTSNFLFVDISEVDDIIVVQPGWQVNAGSTQAPIWNNVIETTLIGNEYRIVVLGFDFTPGTVYTFRNPTSVESVWQFDEFGNLITPGSGSISHRNNDLTLEVNGTDVIVLRTAGGDAVFTNTGDLQLDGGILVGGTVELNNTGTLNTFASGPNNYFSVQSTTNYGVAIRSTDLNLDTKDWLFGVDGNLTFPDNTVQTTAWSGGRVVSVPAHSYGAVGDQNGDLAFDNGYIYRCTADFATHETAITVNSDQWGGSAGGITSLPFSSVRAPQVGWTINITFNSGPATLTITGVTSLGGDRYQVDFNSVGDINVSNGNTGTLVDNLPVADIWKRVAWSGDTW